MAWYNISSVPAVLSGNSQAHLDLSILEDIPDGYSAGFTCLRLILQVIAQPGAASTDHYGAFGVSVVSRDSFIAGALPNPITHLMDWYVLKHFYMRTESDLIAHPIVDVDIRTARKVRGEDRTIVATLETAPASGLIRFSIQARLLLTPS